MTHMMLIKFRALFVFLLGFSCKFLYGIEAPNLGCPVQDLYHGSTNSNLIVLEPKRDNVREEAEGSVVFATPSESLASCYLFRWDDSWVSQVVLQDDERLGKNHVIMIISDRERFAREDQGGSIYRLSIQGFDMDEDKGLGIFEWTSKAPTTPLSKRDYPSSLVAMQELGVNIVFLTREGFANYLSWDTDRQLNFVLNCLKIQSDNAG